MRRKGKTQALPPHSLNKSADKSTGKAQERRPEANRWKGFCFLTNARHLVWVPIYWTQGVPNDGFMIRMVMIRNNENPWTGDALRFRQNGLSPSTTSQGGGQRPRSALRALQMGTPRHGAPLSVEQPPPEPSPSLEKFLACLG